MMREKAKRTIFTCTAANYRGTCDDTPKHPQAKFPEFSLQRLAVYVETKKELDKKLRDIPGGNCEALVKLYMIFDEVIEHELSMANSFKS